MAIVLAFVIGCLFGMLVTSVMCAAAFEDEWGDYDDTERNA